MFFWHRKRGRTAALNAVRTVRILRVLAQFSRADFLLIFLAHFFKEVCTEIEAAKARKPRQSAGQISGLR